MCPSPSPDPPPAADEEELGCLLIGGLADMMWFGYVMLKRGVAACILALFLFTMVCEAGLCDCRGIQCRAEVMADLVLDSGYVSS